MRVLVFRHVPFEGLGLLEPALAARGVAYDYCDLYAPGSALPAADAYDGFIFMGGPMSANDELPFLAQEMRLIERAAGRGTPLLGICLGSQMIARALGGRVYRNVQEEIGWFEIALTAAGLKDPVLGQLAPAETLFHWHSDTFDLPRGAEWLAYSQRTRNQAYRIERSIYGFQFHLEVTPEMIVDWSRETENCGDVEGLESPIDPWGNHVRSRHAAMSVFGRWCDILKPFGSVSERAGAGPGDRVEIPKQQVQPELRSAAEETRSMPRCPKCGWNDVRISYTRTPVDAVLGLISLRRFKCRSCGNYFRRWHPA